jgi:hypothetical protein
VITSHKRVRRFEDNRPDKVLPAGPQTMKTWQHPIIEYHNRLDEFIRLAERTDDLSILGPHADGVKKWKMDFKEVLKHKKGRSSIEWVEKYFDDIPKLENEVRKLNKELNLE